MENYLYAGETEKIIGHALKELGLDYQFLKTRVSLPHKAVEHLKSKHLSAAQWYQICDALCLRVGVISYGYNRRAHKSQLRLEWEKGLLDLPHTPQLKGFINEIKKDRRANHLFQKTTYSRGLRFRIFYRALLPNFKVFVVRNHN